MGEEPLLLGVLYAALGAFTFALNNVAMRRGVVTGSVLQGMAMTVPIGGLSFLVMTVAFGELGQLVVFPAMALAWLAGQGIVHFVFGRYCNYKSNQLMGVNLAAPVVQLQVPFAMMLAVAALHEKFTMLQVIGSVLMLGGSFVTQTKTDKGIKKTSAALPAATPIRTVASQQKQAVPRPGFRPRIFSGYLFALGAAMCYGSSPLMARQAFLNAPGAGTAAAGCLAYAAATLLFSLILLKPGSWDDIRGMSGENLPWFLSSAVLGRHFPGLRLRLACRSATDGGDADPPALSSLPAVSVTMHQPRLRGDECRRPRRRPHSGAGFNPRVARHRRANEAVGPPAVAHRFPALPADAWIVTCPRHFLPRYTLLVDGRASKG
jgi:drug/metabolite transporter (DMT)-like permease